MNNLALNFFGIALGGAVGATLRAVLVNKLGLGSPYSIAVVNLLGCLLFGFYLPRVHNPVVINILFVGLLGSLTTFSTFTADNVKLLDNSNFIFLLLNILGQVGLGLIVFKIAYHFGKNATI